MNIYYLTQSLIDSNRANAIHVRQQAKTLSAVAAEVLCIGMISKRDNLRSNPKGFYLSYFSLPGYGYIYRLYVIIILMLGSREWVVYSRFLFGSFVASLLGYRVGHELHFDEWNRGSISFLFFKSLLNHKNVVLTAITSSIKDECLLYFPNNEKEIFLLPDAASDVELIDSKKDKTTDSIIVGYIGGFYPGKGVDTVIGIAEKMPDVRFCIVGGGRRELIEYYSLSGIPKNVELIHKIPHDQALLKLRDFDICLLPNKMSVLTGKYSDIGRFTSPLKMFEYMAHKKAIVASDLPVIREILDEKTALFSKFDDIDSWVRKIRLLIDDKLLRIELGKNAKERFQQHFTWEIRAKRIVELLSENLK